MYVRVHVCVRERVLPVRGVPSWDYWGCEAVAVCGGRAEILEDPGEEEQRDVNTCV